MEPRPSSTATGKASERTGTAARASMPTPNAADEATSWSVVTSVRRAVSSAPTSEPALSAENSSVNDVVLPPSGPFTSSGTVTEKLKARCR